MGTPERGRQRKVFSSGLVCFTRLGCTAREADRGIRRMTVATSCLWEAVGSAVLATVASATTHGTRIPNGRPPVHGAIVPRIRRTFLPRRYDLWVQRKRPSSGAPGSELTFLTLHVAIARKKKK